ncbi:MAG: hypothetical protein ACRD33_08620 [Candidatus Acidiferrales bacterium]
MATELAARDVVLGYREEPNGASLTAGQLSKPVSKRASKLDCNARTNQAE